MSSSFLASISRALERCAIPGIIRLVVIFNALVFALHLLVPGFITVLTLDPALVLQGQVWRLVTWIFIPDTQKLLVVIIGLLFLLNLGDGLEGAIGSAKLTLFYVSGIIVCTLVSFIFGLAGSGATLTQANTFLNFSLLLAYATLFPDFKVLLFFIIPMRISWLAIISLLVITLSALGQPLVVAASLVATFLNYLLFFHQELRVHLTSWNRGNTHISSITPRKTKEESIETLHRCETCGHTEISHPDLDFRVTASGIEYCREHLPPPPTLS